MVTSSLWEWNYTPPVWEVLMVTFLVWKWYVYLPHVGLKRLSLRHLPSWSWNCYFLFVDAYVLRVGVKWSPPHGGCFSRVCVHFATSSCSPVGYWMKRRNLHSISTFVTVTGSMSNDIILCFGGFPKFSWLVTHLNTRKIKTDFFFSGNSDWKYSAELAFGKAKK